MQLLSLLNERDFLHAKGEKSCISLSRVSSKVRGCTHLQMTYRRPQLDRVYNVPHHKSLIDDLLYSKVSGTLPPPPKTIILESAVMQVLSTASSKALFKREQPL